MLNNDNQKVMSKTIIILGKTGSGKSTLANVISGTNKFKESCASISMTKDTQKEEFITDNGIKYAVVDTVGIGDTKLKKEEVLDKIAEAVYLAREGVSQILFVTSGRFDQFEMSIYNLIRTIIFDEHITKHTTIVRTKFEDFEDEEECQDDIARMLMEKELSEIVNSCQKRVIHVNNSSLSSKYGKQERNSSRKIVLNHLQDLQKECLEQKEVYKPEKLRLLSTEITDYMEKKIESKKKLAEKEKKRLEELRRKKGAKLINIQDVTETIENDEYDNISLENTKKKVKFRNLFVSLFRKKTERWYKKKTESITESEEEQVDNQSLESDESNTTEEIIQLEINKLEGKIRDLKSIKKLKEEIQKADEFIRKKVLSHLLANYDDITKITGGGIFISSIVGDDDNSSTSKLNLVELQEQKEKLEEKLLEQGGYDQSLDEIEKELSLKERGLLDLKKQLLNTVKMAEKWQKKGFSIQQAQE